MTSTTVHLVTAVLACVSLPVVFGASPFLSAPGNTSVLVFMDIHTGENCTESTDWKALAWAHALLWHHAHGNNSNGLEIYDTCQSEDRVLEILRGRLVAGSSSSHQVDGIISYSLTGITSLISESARFVGILHVTAGSRSNRLRPRQTNELEVDFLSAHRKTVVSTLLKQVDWDYVTTLSDGGKLADEEHTSFFSQTTDNGICVQYSQGPQLYSEFRLNDIKTPGVVVFSSDGKLLEQFVSQLPANKEVIVSTSSPDVELEHSAIQDGIVVSERYEIWEDFSSYMAQESWKEDSPNPLIQEFYQNQFNCSYNTSSDTLSCPNVTDIHKHFLQLSTAVQLHVLSSVYDLIAMATEELRQTNCSAAAMSECVDMAALIEDSQFFEDPDGQLALKNSSLVLSRIKSGTVVETVSLDITDTSTFTADLETWLGVTSHPLPSSQCETWCPICQTKSCDPMSQIDLTDTHYVIPGDILLLGMFPLSSEWSENGAGHCSGVPVEKNTDVLVEAFLFALRTASQRYQTLLPNVTVGALIMDTCSSLRKVLQLYMNFESCLYKFRRRGNNWLPSPYITPASITVTSQQQKVALAENLGQTKLRLIIDETGKINDGTDLIYDTSLYNFEMAVELLNQLQWTFVGIVRSHSHEQFSIDSLYSIARSMNVCIDYDEQLTLKPKSTEEVLTIVGNSAANTVVVFATQEDVQRLFRNLLTRSIGSRNWILIETRNNMLDISAYHVPRGTIFVKKQGTQNQNFNSFITTSYANSLESNQNPWKQSFSSARETCSTCKYSDITSNPELLSQASDVIKGVDVTLAAIDRAYKRLCPDFGGLCSGFWTEGTNRTRDELPTVKLNYQGEDIDIATKSHMETFTIYNLQTTGIEKVGSWTGGVLSLDKARVKSYSSRGVLLEQLRDSSCYTTCTCLNINNVTDTGPDVIMFSDLDAEMAYTDSSGAFDSELWAIIVVIIAGTGSLLTILLMVYIMCKVCSGTLMRRYLVLGILLLVAMVFMFLSVLPFVFSPSEAVCGMRYFAHGLAYAFCFAIMLTKMTSLRDYKYIGLGGEISRVNQLLSVLFITGVQIAIGVQWWVTRNPVVYSLTAFEQEDNNLVEKTYYACDFERSDFLAYHAYVIFLIVLCCIYAISVRKETKNMKEARLLLICSWLCLAIWIALIATLLILRRDYLEAVRAIGLLATGLILMAVVYLPKLTAISRLKYEVEQTSRKEQNGYKIDPDFQFERPYSLPGTMHSSITDKTLSYPRSLAAFDTSLSY